MLRKTRGIHKEKRVYLQFYTLKTECQMYIQIELFAYFLTGLTNQIKYNGGGNIIPGATICGSSIKYQQSENLNSVTSTTLFHRTSPLIS